MLWRRLLRRINTVADLHSGVNIDAEWVYRKGFAVAGRWLTIATQAVIASTYSILLGLIDRVYRMILNTTGLNSRVAREWTVDLAVAIVVLLFSIFIIFLVAA